MARKGLKETTEKIISDKEVGKIVQELNRKLEEKRDNILEELSGEIDEQIEFKVNKRMKEEERRILRGKNGKIIRRDIMIILLIGIIGYFGYCLYQVDYFKLNTKAVSSTSNFITDNREKASDTVDYVKQYGYLVDNMQIDDEDIWNLYRDDVTVDTLSNDLKLKLAYKNLMPQKDTSESDIVTFTHDELLTALQEILGDGVTLQSKMFTYNKTRFMFYNNTYIGYMEKSSQSPFRYEIASAKKNGDEMLFGVVVAKEKDGKLFDIDDKVIDKNYRDTNILEYLDSLNMYQYVFENQNGKYIFKELKKE